jgi:hypothetical protein
VEAETARFCAPGVEVQAETPIIAIIKLDPAKILLHSTLRDLIIENKPHFCGFILTKTLQLTDKIHE